METSTGGPIQPATPPAEGVAPPERRGLIRPAFDAVGQFIYWVVLLPVRLFKARKAAPDVIVVYSVHPAFFLWLLIVVGFVSSAIVNYAESEGVTRFFGWVYLWVIVYFLFTLLYDFSTKKLALWAGIFMLVWLLAKYVENLQQVVILGHVFEHLSKLSPRLDPGTATVMSWALLFPWLGSLAHMILNGRKRFTPNEIGEFHFGEGSELTDRTGLRFRTSYRDVLEMILTFGGGDLVAVDNHQNVIKRWNNIVGLFFLWKYLDRILHQRAVVETNEADEVK